MRESSAPPHHCKAAEDSGQRPDKESHFSIPDWMRLALKQAARSPSLESPPRKNSNAFEGGLLGYSGGAGDGKAPFLEYFIVEIAVDQARRRLARDIHDHAGQYLVAARFQLAALEQRATDRSLRSSLAELRMILDRFGEELRAVSTGQSIDVPQGCQLRSALSNLVGQWEHDVGIPVSFLLDLPDSFEPDDVVAEVVFRVAQEGLTNVAKHAPDASAVHISLQSTQQDLKLTIEDDGPGLPALSDGFPGSAVKGTGIDGMRERLKELGGRLVIRSTVGAGTHLISTIPLEAKRIHRGVGTL